MPPSLQAAKASTGVPLAPNCDRILVEALEKTEEVSEKLAVYAGEAAASRQTQRLLDVRIRQWVPCGYLNDDLIQEKLALSAC
ncbi:hypothetical protein [Bradyrhizobium sp. F1.13.3]|uniref:hypothetical protein n=1 Tax=Bradyrhizobium sp. F1.13.3 TaxID=3156351 RepID=UPI00339582F3